MAGTLFVCGSYDETHAPEVTPYVQFISTGPHPKGYTHHVNFDPLLTKAFNEYLSGRWSADLRAQYGLPDRWKSPRISSKRAWFFVPLIFLGPLVFIAIICLKRFAKKDEASLPLDTPQSSFVLAMFNEFLPIFNSESPLAVKSMPFVASLCPNAQNPMIRYTPAMAVEPQVDPVMQSEMAGFPMQAQMGVQPVVVQTTPGHFAPQQPQKPVMAQAPVASTEQISPLAMQAPQEFV